MLVWCISTGILFFIGLWLGANFGFREGYTEYRSRISLITSTHGARWRQSQDVIWAYQHLLGRDPTPSDHIEGWAGLTLETLLANIMNSDEFLSLPESQKSIARLALQSKLTTATNRSPTQPAGYLEPAQNGDFNAEKNFA
jgi:hypothetical protein